MYVEDLNKRCRTSFIYFSLFLSIHHAQQMLKAKYPQKKQLVCASYC